MLRCRQCYQNVHDLQALAGGSPWWAKTVHHVITSPSHRTSVLVWMLIEWQMPTLLLYFYHLPAVECEVFVVGDVAELVAEAAGGADGLVNVTVGVAVDPVVDSAVGDVVGQFNGERAVDAAALELRGNQLIGWDMVGDDDLVLGLAGADGLLDEVEAALMLDVEVGIPQQVLAIDDAVKVGHAPLGNKGVVKVDMCP